MLKRTASISLRLTLWFGAVFFFASVLFGTAMWFSLKQTLEGERRQTLERRLDRLQDLLNANPAASGGDRLQDFRDFAHATGNGLMEVFDARWQRVYPSPSNAAARFPWPEAHRVLSQRFDRVEVSDQPYLTIARPYNLRGHPVVLVAAAPESGNLLVLKHFRASVFASFPLLLVVACAGGYWISRRALQPVDRITAAARSIGIRNLSERIPVVQSGDELQRLAETSNEMLNRLDAAVKRLKQFTADASHELRAPLSLARTVAEVALRNPRVDAQSREALQEIVDETAKATSLLEQMLLLARADSETCCVEMEPVNLAAIVRETSAAATRVADEKGLTLALSCSAPDSLEVLGNLAHLRRLVWILVDNALKYTTAPGRIDIALVASADSATLQVTDTGIGIAPKDLPHIFDRFYRADSSRSHVEGSGLGLAIASWIADIHRSRITVSSALTLGSTFSVSFRYENLSKPTISSIRQT